MQKTVKQTRWRRDKISLEEGHLVPELLHRAVEVDAVCDSQLAVVDGRRLLFQAHVVVTAKDRRICQRVLWAPDSFWPRPHEHHLFYLQVRV